MSQKRDDFGVIPMCSIHHKEQHSIGWPRFIQLYELDVPAILAELREKPRLVIWRTGNRGLFNFYALYRGQEFLLEPAAFGAGCAFVAALQICSEYLRNQLLQRRAA